MVIRLTQVKQGSSAENCNSVGACILLKSTSTWMVNMGGNDDSNGLVAIRDVDDSLRSLTTSAYIQ